MITPQEYAAQEAERIKAKHDLAYERALQFLEERVRGPGVYKLRVDFMGEPLSIQAAQDPELLNLVAKEFQNRLQKAGWSLFVTDWAAETWWRAGYVKVETDRGFEF